MYKIYELYQLVIAENITFLKNYYGFGPYSHKLLIVGSLIRETYIELPEYKFQYSKEKSDYIYNLYTEYPLGT